MLESTNSLHHKCHFINVRGGETLTFFSLYFELGFQEGRKCDGHRGLLILCCFKRGGNEREGVPCLVQTGYSDENFGEGRGCGCLLELIKEKQRGNNRNCSHMGLLYLLASSR